MSLKIEELRSRIQELETLSGEDLKNAMTELKKALKENPAACLQMLPEDIGQCVAALRKITGQAIVSAATKSKSAKAEEKKAKNKPLTQEEIQQALDEL